MTLRYRIFDYMDRHQWYLKFPRLHKFWEWVVLHPSAHSLMMWCRWLTQ
jgi:hypothetical protein